MTTTNLKFDPQRLTALAGIARKASAARSGQNEELHDQRDARRDLQARISRAQAAFATGGVGREQAELEVKRLQAEVADLSGDITVREVELDEIAAAASAARANLKSALKYAKSEGLSIPTALAEEADNA